MTAYKGQITTRMGLRALACFVVLLAGRPSAHAQTAQTPLSVDEYRGVLFDALAKVGKDHPDLARDIRVLGVGSWVGYAGVGKVGDMDATLGHPDPKIEKMLVAEANKAIVDGLAATNRPHDPKFIKLIHNREYRFVELFRGEAGQKFALDYATKKAPEGLATFAWNADGQVVRKPAESFWIDTRKALPIQITQPQRFLDDSWLMVNNLRKAQELTQVERAMSAAKYLNNIEQWLVPGLEAQYKSGPLTALMVDEASRRQMVELLAIKSRNLGESEQRAAIARLFNVPLSQVDGAIGSWMTKVEAHLVQTSSIAGLIDGLGRAGKLEASLLNRVLTSGARIAEKLGPYLLGTTAADRALRLGEIALVAYIGTSQGWEKGTEQLAMTLSGWLVPAVAAGALIAEIGKALVVGGVRLAGNTLIFSPLNNDALETMFDPNDPTGVYSGRNFENFPNPFMALKGLNRETLYHRFPENAKKFPADPALERTNVRALFTAMANQYLARWIKERTTLFTTEGAGAFTADLIVDRIMADWEFSRRMAMEVRRLELELNAGEKTRPDVPFQVLLDKAEVPPKPVALKPFAKTTKPGQPAVFQLMLVRGFGTRRFLRTSINLVDKWAELGGKAALNAWLIQNDKNDAVFYHHYDGDAYERAENPDPPDIRAEVTVRGATGWSLDGDLPVNLQSVIAGNTSGQRNFFIKHGEVVSEESSPYKDRSFRIVLTPGPDAQPITLTVKLGFIDAFAPDKPETADYEMVLTARVETPTLTTVNTPNAPVARPAAPRPGVEPPTPQGAPLSQCETTYQAAVWEIRGRTLWNIAGYSNASNGCPAAEIVLDACYKAANVRRDSGIHNADTDECRNSFISACRGENLAAATATRDKCLANANTEREVQKARDQAAVALQKAREGQRARELAKQAQLLAEQLARQQEADRLRKIEEEKRAAERRAREQAQQAESQQARRWEELQRQGAAQAALDRQREIDAQRRRAEEADARRRADAERRQREEQDRAETDARNRPPASDPVPPPPISTPPQIPPPTSRPSAEGWPSDFTLETTTEPRGASGVGRVRKEVFEVQQNKLIRYNGLTTAQGTFNDGLLQGRWPAEGMTFEFRLNRDGTVVWKLDWVEPSNGQPRGAVRDGTWTMKPLGGSASPSASQPPQVPSPPGQTPPHPSTPPAQTPPARTPPPTAPPGQQQPPCPPAPLPGLANQQTNLRCFGIPGPGR